MNDIYTPPESNLETSTNAEPEYAGFWIRVVASIVDTILLMVVLVPITLLFAGLSGGFSGGLMSILVQYLLPAVAVILFWKYKSATPGKLMLNLKVVDAETLGPVPTGRLVLRYLGYYVSMIPLLIGLIWVGFDSRKQGWHDKIARTLIIKDK